MLVLIESDLGEITLDVSFAAYCGAKNLNERGSSAAYVIKKTSLDGVSFALINNKEQIVLPVGGGQFVKKVADLLDVKLPVPLNVPDVLQPYLGRKTWTVKRSELQESMYPCFVKPKYEMKLFTGFVATSAKSWELYSELVGWDGELWCSEVIPDIISEWRCYILNGKVLNCSNYMGDPLAFPDKNEIQYLASVYQNAPVGYSLDVAVTPTGTKLVECNDAWSLGYYGGDFIDYFKMVKERWLEILKTQ